jgi:acyl-CoA thioester hydrolase
MAELNADEIRENYPHFLTIPTRWRDVDMYQHVNNVVFYAYFDTVIGDYLIKEAGLDFTRSPIVGFAAETCCQFFKTLRFPEVIDVGLRVGKLGNSSARYEIGVFKQGESDLTAVGYFVHVFVERQTQRPTKMPAAFRSALERLMVSS